MEQFLTNEENEFSTTGQKLGHNFFLCLLARSSRSLTHFETYFKRYYNTIQRFLKDSELYFLNQLDKIWANSEFHLKLYVDKIISLKLLKHEIAIDWIF